MKLSDWARKNGLDYKTAYRMYRSGTLPSRNLEKLAVSWTERLNACESGELWPLHSGGETALNEAGIEHHLGEFLNG